MKDVIVLHHGVLAPFHDNTGPIASIRSLVGCLWEVCDRFMRKCTQVAEKEQCLSEFEGDEVSSYGTGPSSDGRMDSTRLALAASEGADMGTLFAAIATFARGQSILTEKVTLLEKVVGTVQFDMTWVRDDMKAVHQVMERIADNICDIREGVPEVDVPLAQVSVDASPPQAWKGKEQETDNGKPPSASTSRGEHFYDDDDMLGGNVDRDMTENHEEETYANIRTNDAEMNNMAVAGEGRREWGHARTTTPALRMSQWPQSRVNIDMEPLQEESQRIEMSCQSSQLPTLVTDRSMWLDFTAAVRGWQAPSEPVSAVQEGWVKTKKGRWEPTEYGKVVAEPGSSLQAEAHGTLDLGMVAERLGETGRPRGEGAIPATDCIAEASKKGTNGSGRGAGRGRGLPAVQPRFHTPVRVGTPSSLDFMNVGLCATLGMHGQECMARNGRITTNKTSVHCRRGCSGLEQIAGSFTLAMDGNQWRRGLLEVHPLMWAQTPGTSGVT